MTAILIKEKNTQNQFFQNLLKTAESHNVNILEFNDV